MEIYLGDGAYVKFSEYELELYTTDGVKKTNSVFLDFHAMKLLMGLLVKLGMRA